MIHAKSIASSNNTQQWFATLVNSETSGTKGAWLVVNCKWLCLASNGIIKMIFFLRHIKVGIPIFEVPGEQCLGAWKLNISSGQNWSIWRKDWRNIQGFGVSGWLVQDQSLGEVIFPACFGDGGRRLTVAVAGGVLDGGSMVGSKAIPLAIQT